MTYAPSRGRWKKLTDAKAAEARSLYEGGASIAQAAAAVGVSRQSLYGTLKRLGVTFRSHLRTGPENPFYRGGPRAVDAAQNKLEKAVQHGRVERPTRCEECGQIPPPFKNGRTAIQAHHPNYAKPLEVRWLCQRCHHRAHGLSA